MYYRNETRENIEEAMSLANEIESYLEDALNGLDELEEENEELKKTIEENEEFIAELAEQNRIWHDEIVELRAENERLQKAYNLLRDIKDFFEDEMNEIIANEVEKEINEVDDDCPF